MVNERGRGNGKNPSFFRKKKKQKNLFGGMVKVV
jgi:hypothetical protein